MSGKERTRGRVVRCWGQRGHNRRPDFVGFADYGKDLSFYPEGFVSKMTGSEKLRQRGTN